MGTLLKRVAAATKLGCSRLKEIDKVPRNYDGCPFTLHGRIDLDIRFEGVTMQTPVYIKLDVEEPLLLSEGVCRQLRILSYHPGVVGHKEQETKIRSPSEEAARVIPLSGSDPMPTQQPLLSNKVEKQKLTLGRARVGSTPLTGPGDSANSKSEEKAG